MRDMTHLSVLRDSYIGNMTHCYKSQVVCISVTWLIHIRDMTHQCVTWLMNVWFDSCMWDLTGACGTWHMHVWLHMSCSMHVQHETWCMCNMTYACVAVCNMKYACVPWHVHRCRDICVRDMTCEVRRRARWCYVEEKAFYRSWIVVCWGGCISGLPHVPLCVYVCVCVCVCERRKCVGNRKSERYLHCNTLQYTATHCNTLQHTVVDRGSELCQAL